MAKQNERQQKWEKDYIVKIDFLRELAKTRSEFIKTLQHKAETTNGDPAATGDANAGTSDYVASGLSADELVKKSLKGSSGYTAEELNGWLNAKTQGKKCKNCGQNSHMYNAGADFIEAEKIAGYRADAMIAHAAEESGWGTSAITCKKKNFYGYGAVDSNPMGGAYSWKDHKEGLIGAAKLIAEGYIYRSKKFSGQADQDTFWLMNHPPASNPGHRYASNDAWPTNIAKLWSGAPARKAAGGGGGGTVAGKDYKGTGNQASISGGKLTHMTGNRGAELSKRRDAGRANNWAGYTSLDTSIFTPSNAVENTVNRVAPDAAAAFTLLAQNIMPKTGRDKVVLTSIWRASDSEAPQSPHLAGCAIDIQCKGMKDALTIADTAWAIGFRGVAVGGNLSGGMGFVHVDIGPPGTWGYGGYPKYTGPDSFGGYR